MNYISDYVSRYGFDSGENIPAGAAAFRTVFVQLFNARARAMGSQARALCYERPVGNYMAILFLCEELVKTLGIKDPLAEEQVSQKICNAELKAPQFLSIVDERVGPVLDWLDENVDWGGIIEIKVSINQSMFQLTLEDCINTKE